MYFKPPISARKLARERYLEKLGQLRDGSHEAIQGLAGLEFQRQVIAAASLRLAADFAESNPASDPADFEAEFALAGPGAPTVAEYAIAVLSASLSMTDFAARKLLGDALEIKHRLPKLWGLVQDLRVPAWKVRGICDHTQTLSLDAVAWIDDELAANPDRVNLCRIEKLADRAEAFFDPVAHREAEVRAAEHRGVYPHRPGQRNTQPIASTTRIEMVLDTPDADALEATIKAVANALAEQGDPSDLQVRRARAVGLLAQPEQVLNLLEGAGHSRTPEVTTTLMIHLLPNQSIGIEEQLGPITAELTRTWTQPGSKVTIRPILHLSQDPAVDQHDPPESLREQVLQRNAQCVFPGCNRDSRRCDLDHVIAYVPGLPAQTSPSNLAPLCRYHHRVKTHGDWHYQLHPDGSVTWTSPDQTQFHKPGISRAVSFANAAGP